MLICKNTNNKKEKIQKIKLHGIAYVEKVLHLLKAFFSTVNHWVCFSRPVVYNYDHRHLAIFFLQMCS